MFHLRVSPQFFCRLVRGGETMRAFFRNLLLSFLVTGAFAGVSGTIAAADTAPSSVLAGPDCPAGTNWDAVLQRCR
jgi:hypothetical protein